MSSKIYEASITHTENTVERLYRARYHTYEKPRMLFRMGIGLALIFVAAFVEINMILRGVILLIGAWLLVSADFPAVMQADKALETRKAKLPVMRYKFEDEYFTITGEGSMKMEYKKLKKLAYDRDYLFLFVSADNVCMVDRKTIKPDTGIEFLKFLMNKTGIEWQQEKSILSINFYDIKNMLKERKEKQIKAPHL